MLDYTGSFKPKHYRSLWDENKEFLKHAFPVIRKGRKFYSNSNAEQWKHFLQQHAGNG